MRPGAHIVLCLIAGQGDRRALGHGGVPCAQIFQHGDGHAAHRVVQHADRGHFDAAVGVHRDAVEQARDGLALVLAALFLTVAVAVGKADLHLLYFGKAALHVVDVHVHHGVTGDVDHRDLPGLQVQRRHKEGIGLALFADLQLIGPLIHLLIPVDAEAEDADHVVVALVAVSFVGDAPAALRDDRVLGRGHLDALRVLVRKQAPAAALMQVIDKARAAADKNHKNHKKDQQDPQAFPAHLRWSALFSALRRALAEDPVITVSGVSGGISAARPGRGGRACGFFGGISAARPGRGGRACGVFTVTAAASGKKLRYAAVKLAELLLRRLPASRAVCITINTHVLSLSL